MRVLILLSVFTFLTPNNFSQEKLESDIDYAYQNAKKGIYWALSNVPEKKKKIESDLIAEDRLYADVRLDMEVNGVKIISRGYYQSNEVEIIVYRSFDSLIKDGYLKIENE